MRYRLRFLALLLALFLCLVPDVCVAQTEASDIFSIPNGVLEIESEAFASIPGNKVFIPESVREIAPNAFTDIEDKTIYGIEGSYAQSYASSVNSEFVPVAITDIRVDAPAWTSPNTETEFRFSANAALPSTYRLTIEKDGAVVFDSGETNQESCAYTFTEGGVYSYRLTVKNQWMTEEKLYENAIEVGDPIQLIRPAWQVSVMDSFGIVDENEMRPFLLTSSGDGLLIEDDLVTALKTGFYTVTVSIETEKGTVYAFVPVEVIIPVSEIIIECEQFSLSENSEMLLTARVLPENATYPAVTWQSSDNDIAEIDANGLIHAHMQGDVIITAINQDLEASVSIRITRNVRALTIEPEVLVDPFYTNMTMRLISSATPEEADDHSVTWTSDNPAVASVDSDTGVVSALKQGSATITATANDEGRAQADYEIQVSQGVSEITFTSLPGVLVKGDTFPVEYSLAPADAPEIGLTFTSDNDQVASVTEKGLITAVGPGTCVITAVSHNGIQKTFTVEVAIRETAVDVALNNVFLNPGDTISPMDNFVFIQPANATYQKLTWTSSNPASVKVNASTGVITAQTTGTAVITGTTHYGLKAAFTVNVVTDASVIKKQYVSPTYAVLKTGDAIKLTPSCSPVTKYATGVWYSSDESVAVIEQGDQVFVRAKAPGTATIYAISSSGIAAKCEVLVNPVFITSLSMSASSLALNNGDSFQLSASYQPSNAQATFLTWQSSDPDVAEVNDKGIVFAKAGGTCRITAETENGLSASCFVIVNTIKMTSATPVNEVISASAGDQVQIAYTFEPAHATPAKFQFKSASPSVAQVDSKTGLITMIAEGETVISAQAADGSGVSFIVSVAVTETPVSAFRVNETDISLRHGESFEIISTVLPENASWAKPRFHSADTDIATVTDSGVITGVSKGTTTVFASVGRDAYEKTLEIKVSVTSDSTTTYRALVVGQFAVPGEEGFLPFSTNSTKGVSDALKRSVIDGNKYSVRLMANNPTPTAFRSALSLLSSQADSNDVTVVFLLTHGSHNATNGYFMETSSGTNIQSGALLDALTEISGDVVLVLCTCHSGRILSNSKVQAVMSEGGRYTGKNGQGRLSILCSSTDTISSYYKIENTSASYDFFTYAFLRALGWDMLKDSSLGSPLADSNGDGLVTLSELSKYSRTHTQRAISTFIQMNGTSQFSGNQRQYPSWWFGSGAGELVLFGK